MTHSLRTPQPSPALPKETTETNTEIDVDLRGIRKQFDDQIALDGIDLQIRRGEFFSLLGPSGCGKTTLLRILAGLELADQGQVLIRGKDVGRLPANQRSVNTVFQNYALFPYLTVAENVAFGLKMRRFQPQIIDEKVAEALELVEIGSLAKRLPQEISGGQKQRVALARAIVNEPDVLLLDEPLSALDAKLRRQLQVQLCNLQRRLGMTFIFVTHDQDEALVMSDRVAVMRQGRIEQMGPIDTVYERPANAFVAAFIGASNLISASACHLDCVDTDLGQLMVPGVAAQEGALRLSIRPEKIRLSREGFGMVANQIKVKVEDLIYTGAENQYVLSTSSQYTLTASIMNADIQQQGYDIGEDLIAYLPPQNLIPVPE